MSMAAELPLIAITGPTASGKTRLAVAAAKALGAEIVSADSRQVYRRMDIGTGKDIAEYDGVPYHLIDICEPGEKYNLFRFLADYNRAVDDIRARGARPLLCGGTGMYIEAAVNGLTMPAVPPDNRLRESLSGRTLQELTALLASMKTLHNTTDVDTPQRAIRAIEIENYYRLHPDTRPLPASPHNRPKAILIALDIDRETRRSRITQRLHARLDNGMEREVEALLQSGLTPDDLIYYGLEYKWLTLAATGRITRREMIENLETAIHQFAKRQMTWIRGMERRGLTVRYVPYDIDPQQFVDLILSWQKQS